MMPPASRGVGRVAADRAEQDRVVLRQALERPVVEDLAGGEVVRGAQLELGLDQLDAVERCTHGPPGLQRDLRADAVSCDHREAQLLHTSSLWAHRVRVGRHRIRAGRALQPSRADVRIRVSGARQYIRPTGSLPLGGRNERRAP